MKKCYKLRCHSHAQASTCVVTSGTLGKKEKRSWLVFKLQIRIFPAQKDMVYTANLWSGALNSSKAPGQNVCSCTRLTGLSLVWVEIDRCSHVIYFQLWVQTPNMDTWNVKTIKWVSPVLWTCKVHCPWVLFCKTMVYSSRSRLFGRGIQVQADYCNSMHSYIMPGAGGTL